MLKIRLKRVGAKKQPYYRIVVMPARSPRDGEALERIGTYYPRANPPKYEIKTDRAVEWMRRGAQPTEVVHSIFKKTGVLKAMREGVPAETPATSA